MNQRPAIGWFGILAWCVIMLFIVALSMWVGI